ncbi:hypothetical protein IQ07DRAFT_621178 [Pyrenochaeta sp. DS3sAY3a]|nr:hypothetical protein IQ07DRAFT_621178 [Pyrenochaeta sp. DS3sAY3a]
MADTTSGATARAGLRVWCLATTNLRDGPEEQERGTGGEDEAEDEDGGEGEMGDEDAEDQELDAGDVDSESPLSPSASNSDSDSDSDSDSSSDADSSEENESPSQDGPLLLTSAIHDAQLSADGSTIFTADYTRTFSVYPVYPVYPVDKSDRGPRLLEPYGQAKSPNPIWAFASNPFFNVQDASSTHVLISRRDSYITLHNALWDTSKSYEDGSLTETKRPVDLRHPLGSYKLVNKNTEAVQAPMSLTYSHHGTHFFAGTSSSIATFDLQRFDGPITNMATIPSTQSKLKGGGRGFKGQITALELSPPCSSASSSGLLAAGSLTRYIGLYDARSGEETTHFALPGTFNGRKVYNEALKDVNGDGISHLKWSPCGTYLYAAERKSDILLIYDARNVSLALGHCAGRKALSKQKMGFDVWCPGAASAAAVATDTDTMSHELWAGGTDGCVRVWRDPWAREGAVPPDEVLRVRDEAVPVTSTLVHPSGGVAVAACGVLGVLEYDDDEGEGEGEGQGVGMPRVREWGCLEVFGFGGL